MSLTFTCGSFRRSKHVCKESFRVLHPKFCAHSAADLRLHSPGVSCVNIMTYTNNIRLHKKKKKVARLLCAGRTASVTISWTDWAFLLTFFFMFQEVNMFTFCCVNILQCPTACLFCIDIWRLVLDVKGHACSFENAFKNSKRYMHAFQRAVHRYACGIYMLSVWQPVRSFYYFIWTGIQLSIKKNNHNKRNNLKLQHATMKIKHGWQYIKVHVRLYMDERMKISDQ